MNAPILLLTCAFAIIIPILIVQIPRYYQPDDTRQPMAEGSETLSRRPWDPPFPTTPKHLLKENTLLSSLPRRESAPCEEDTNEQVDRCKDTQYTRPSTLSENKPCKGKLDQHKASLSMSVIWTTVIIMVGILSLFLFALFITHCLAWFIVYKTEARLGEARRGLVQGGEMRLCLCARG
jgi:hypothetical protein